MRKCKESQHSADAQEQIRIAPHSPDVLRGCKVLKSNGHDISWFSRAPLDSFLGHAVVILTARMRQSEDLHTVHKNAKWGGNVKHRIRCSLDLSQVLRVMHSWGSSASRGLTAMLDDPAAQDLRPMQMQEVVSILCREVEDGSVEEGLMDVCVLPAANL